jgi:hypothetical protein
VQIKHIFKEDAKMALAISQAENGTRVCDRVSKPNKNGTVDIGVFQINASAHRNKATPEQLKDCLTNIQVAKQIYDRQGWTPWTVYKTGRYKQYLN